MKGNPRGLMKLNHNRVGVIQGYGGASIGGVYDGNRVLESLYTWCKFLRILCRDNLIRKYELIDSLQVKYKLFTILFVFLNNTHYIADTLFLKVSNKHNHQESLRDATLWKLTNWFNSVVKLQTMKLHAEIPSLSAHKTTSKINWCDLVSTIDKMQ